MDRSVFSKAALACLLVLAVPGTAHAAVGASVARTAPATDSVNEAGEVTFTITCGTSAPFDIASTGEIDYVVSGATQGQDYAATSGSVVCGALAPQHTVSVDLLDDAVDEPQETITMTISKGVLFSGEIATATAIAKLEDDDVPEVSIAQFVALFEDAGPAQLTVTLSQTPVEPATVSFATENSSASAPGDFTATSGELTIPAGQTTGTITVPIANDTAPETVEGFYVNLSAPVNATLSATRKQATVAIFDKDTPPVPAFALPRGVAVEEGNAGTVNVLFPITASPAPTEAVRVNWRTANFTAASSTDYESGNGTVTFEPGQTTKTVSVNVKSDLRDEPNEAFGLVLGNPVGGTIAAGSSFGVITDDDGPKVGIGRPVARGKSLIMLVTCPKASDLCRGTLAAKIGKLRAGSARFDLAKGAGTELKLKLTRRARALLAERARRMKFTATAADASGAQRVTTKRYRVRRLA